MEIIDIIGMVACAIMGFLITGMVTLILLTISEEWRNRK